MNLSVRWSRSYSGIVVSLTLVALILLVAVAFRFEWISASELVDNKDVIDVVTKILGASVLTLGAVASYFRFFKGRTLSPRLSMDAKVEVFPANSERNLHVLTINVANVGSVAAWGMDPQLRIQYYGGQSRPEEFVRKWFKPIEGEEDSATVPVLDTEESTQYVVVREVPRDVWAVIYAARIAVSSGHSWQHIVSASNQLEASPDK